MAVAIVLRNKQDIDLTHWAARLATARGLKLVLIWAQHRRGAAKICEVEDTSELPEDLIPTCEDLLENGFHLLETDPDKKDEPKPRMAANSDPASGTEEPATLPIEFVTIQSEHLARDLTECLQSKRLSCLVLPRDFPVGDDAVWQDAVMQQIHCEIVLLIEGTQESGNCRRIVSPVGQGPNSATCLRVAHDLVSSVKAKLIALHVTPEIDETAKWAAVETLSKSVDRVLGEKTDCVDVHVELTNNVIAGIQQTVDEDTDLVVLGIKRIGLSKRVSTSGLAQKLLQAKPGPTIAIVQSAVPISSRLGTKLNELLRGFVPQLTRDRRIELVKRIQTSSEWDFDFIMLICLSTIIAAGGLIQNSAAVVIGAMLVAPLMTPLLGSGLAIVQGNWILFKSTLATVARGFVLALIIGFLVAMFGSLVLDVTLTDQLLQRGNPSALDIAIGMVGGIAAAYASGRPNLLSALPGVAIAAALVPPIATAGISMFLGEFGLAFRAVLLFVTNIVAIILGTAMAFRATGIQGRHARWTIPTACLLLLTVISLAYYESLPQQNSASLLQRINYIAQESENWKCLSAEHRMVEGEEVLTLKVESAAPMSEETLDQIHALVKRSHEMEVSVRILVDQQEQAADPTPQLTTE